MATVFISVSNMGCIELTMNHLESLKRVGITNYIAYAIDVECFELLKSKGYTTELIGRDEFKEFHEYGGGVFNNISFFRYHVIRKLLEEDKTVWYLDVDTVVLKDLNSYIDMAKGTCDIAMQDDINMPCTGCMLLFPSSAPLIQKMVEVENPEHNDQIYMTAFLREGNFRLSLFDRHVFPNGLLCFSKPVPKYERIQKEFQEFSRKRLSDIAFVHANWMTGLQIKIDAFKSKGLWLLS